jgi:hypothetical protein
VESTFGAVKWKVGDNVRSREDAAMANEVLYKLLCQNLADVIRSQIELGIEAAFWNENEDGPRDVLPMVRRG